MDSTDARLPQPVTEPSWAERDAVRRRPSRSPVMYQRWHDLLFLHWRWDAGEIQRTLPDGLRVDTWEGAAWLAVVPFRMSGVRPRGLPAVAGVSDFMELNLRTYVRSADGTPGVWFYSLDCNRRLAVALAQGLFGLPYVYAKMSQEGRLDAPGGVRDYRSWRPGAKRGDRFAYELAGPVKPAAAESVEWWLAERYVLFAGGSTKRPLRRGRVWHEPYGLSSVRLTMWETTLFEANGFAAPSCEPDHVMASAGVEVDIYPMERVPG